MLKASETQSLLWDTMQAAKSLGISQRKLWSLVDSGEVPHIRIGRCLRFSPDDLRRWIETKRQGNLSLPQQ